MPADLMIQDHCCKFNHAVPLSILIQLTMATMISINLPPKIATRANRHQSNSVAGTYRLIRMHLKQVSHLYIYLKYISEIGLSFKWYTPHSDQIQMNIFPLCCYLFIAHVKQFSHLYTYPKYIHISELYLWGRTMIYSPIRIKCRWISSLWVVTCLLPISTRCLSISPPSNLRFP